MFLDIVSVGIIYVSMNGCGDTILQVPAAAVNVVGNVVGGIWGAVTSIF